MASILRVDTLTDASSNNSIATSFIAGGSAKMWVNFDGGASGAAARDSLNVSGMTDSGSGQYIVSINSDMGNVNYSTTDSVGDHDNVGESHAYSYVHTQAVGSVGIITAHYDGAANQDRSNVCIQVCGDLA